jgi:hypothetical protein
MCPFEINGFVKSLGIQLFVNGIFKIDWPRILFGILILPRKRRQCMANQHHVDNVSQVQTVSKRIGIVSQVQTVSKRIGIVSQVQTVSKCIGIVSQVQTVSKRIGIVTVCHKWKRRMKHACDISESRIRQIMYQRTEGLNKTPECSLARSRSRNSRSRRRSSS